MTFGQYVTGSKHKHHEDLIFKRDPNAGERNDIQRIYHFAGATVLLSYTEDPEASTANGHFQLFSNDDMSVPEKHMFEHLKPIFEEAGVTLGNPEGP